MAAEGQTYIVGQGGGIPAGGSVTLTLSGLPHRATWPRNIALVLAAAILGAGVWGAAGGPKTTRRADKRRAVA
jgi:hypothetical protein